MKNQRLLPVLILGLVLFIAVLMIPANLAGPVQAAPPAAPTPITGVVASDAGNYFVFLDAQAFAADGYSDAVTLASFEWADWQYLIDNIDTNTTTVTIQYSNDGANWVNGPALISSNAGDAGDMTRLPLFGRYTRLHVNSTTTDTLTLSVNVLAK